MLDQITDLLIIGAILGVYVISEIWLYVLPHNTRKDTDE